MNKVVIQWFLPHHPKDGYDRIQSELEAGGDEGPLLVIPDSYSYRSHLSGEPLLIFEDIDSYFLHLMLYENEDIGEQWVALVRREGREDNRNHNLAAIHHIKELLTPKRRFKNTVARRRNAPPPRDYRVLAGSFFADEDLLIENISFDWIVQETFPQFEEEMVVLGTRASDESDAS